MTEEIMNRIGRDLPSNLVEMMTSRFRKITSIRRQAKRIMKEGLPDFEVEVPLPDAQTMFSWIEGICATPHRRAGTPEGHQAESWLNERFNEIGLEKVTIDEIPIDVWTANSWSLEVEGTKIPSYFILNTSFTGPMGITAPMVYVKGGRQKDFEGLDVSGKIVVAELIFLKSQIKLYKAISYFISDPDKELKAKAEEVHPVTGLRLNFLGDFFKDILPESGNFLQAIDDVYKNAVKRGASAIILILRDQPSKYYSHYAPYDAVFKEIPGLFVGKYEGMELRKMAQQGKEATVVLDGKVEPGHMANVWGVLPGQSEDVILITCHHDSPHKGAVEDGAGICQILTQAWAWSRVPLKDRPKTIVFVGSAGHFYGAWGGYHFVKAHPEIMKRAKILLTLEHLAAKEVEEGPDGEYVFTGNPSLTQMFIADDPKTIAAAMKALKKKPAKSTVVMSTFGGFLPTDALGFVVASSGASPETEFNIEKSIPFISWISSIHYLLDEGDTLDKVDKDNLRPIAETVTEIVKNLMVLN